MPRIVVCPLSQVSTSVITHQASHLVTLINEGNAGRTSVSITAERHLLLSFNDIIEPIDGMTAPAEEHARDLLSFVGAWDGSKRSSSIATPASAVRRPPPSSPCARFGRNWPRPILPEASVPPRHSQPRMSCSWVSLIASLDEKAAWSPRSHQSVAARWPMKANLSLSRSLTQRSGRW